MPLQELLGDRQNARLLRLSFPKGDAPQAQLLANRLKGSEYLSRDFHFTVELLSDDAQIELEALQGKMMCVSVVLPNGKLRPFTGYVSHFRLVRTDGGTAFYEAELVPWFAFAKLRRNNRLFHQQSLQEQAQTILQDYTPLAKWEWQVSAEQRQHTMLVQFGESDHNALSWRWEAAGWVYFYAQAEQGHTLTVVSDTPSLPPIDGPSPEIRFHRGGGSEEEEAIGQWSSLREWAPGSMAVSGFDFKSPKPVHAEVPTINQQGDVPALEVHSYEGHYGFKHNAGAEKLARQRMEEAEARAKIYEAHSNNRFAAPGRWFKLTDHFNHSGEEAEFLILAVHHEASNNYLQASEQTAEYKNRFTCQRRKTVWRPGLGFNSTPTKIVAPQTATVVGPEAEGSLHVDEYGRVRVRFHWDRDETSSCWVRVTSNWAGGQNGLASHPRVGSEVLIQHLDGNVDHPLITGSIHNQSYMPPWKLPEQRALMGLRSRELAGSAGNSASGRSSHLVLDDTQGSIQAQLGSDHLSSQLSLGHITRLEGHAGRTDARGQGFELRTDGHGAVRSQRGLLVTTEGRPDGRSHITDMGETVQRLDQGKELHNSLSEAAQLAKGHEAGDQDEVIKALQAQIEALKGKGGNPKQNEFPEFQDPHLLLSSPAGIQTTAQGSTHQASNEHHAITSGAHTSVSAGKSLLVSVREAVRMFAYKAGMKLVAASADIDITALKDSVNILAKLNITHTANRITITAKEEVVINGGTSYSRWNASGIVHGTNGLWREHAARHSLVVGNAQGRPNLPETTVLPTGQLDLYHQYVDPSGKAVQAVKQGDYTVIDAEGGVHNGTLDGKGFASLGGLAMGAAKVFYGKDPRNTWESGSYFGKPDEWPKVSEPVIEHLGQAALQGGAAASTAPTGPQAGALTGILAAAGGASAAMSKVAPLANAARQAAGAAQALKQGAGVQALLGSAAQAIPAGKEGGPLGAVALQAARKGLPTVLPADQPLPGALPRPALADFVLPATPTSTPTLPLAGNALPLNTPAFA